MKEEIIMIIPAYKPKDSIMCPFMEKLKKEFSNIVIIDDGSGPEYIAFFKEMQKKGFTVLKHHINLGKGRAIKTAFNYCLNTYPNMIGTITADCDGQHTVEDILKCAVALEKEPKAVVIGTRNFDASNVPFKSRYGNKLTRTMFSLFVGIKITDTQSGLRGFGIHSMKIFLEISGERYEYETNMLIACKEKEMKITEVPIETVYINNNELSHFNPFRDSLLIYKLFIRYVFASVSSFLVDIFLFMVFMHILPEFSFGCVTTIVLATILARIFSSIYNFILNARVVFKNKGKDSLIKYFSLVGIQMLASAFLVSKIFYYIKINIAFLKIVVDVILFMINFTILREWVFKTKKV